MPMERDKNEMVKQIKSFGTDFFEHVWEESYTHVKTVEDAGQESMLIMDATFQIIVANKIFYKTFGVGPEDVENKYIYDMCGGQWNIPALRTLLEGIITKNTFFKGFEVTNEFPCIGRKTMILNARQIHFKENITLKLPAATILLTIEDVTEMMLVAERFAQQERTFEDRFVGPAHKLEVLTKQLEKQINTLKNVKK